MYYFTTNIEFCWQFSNKTILTSLLKVGIVSHPAVIIAAYLASHLSLLIFHKSVGFGAIFPFQVAP